MRWAALLALAAGAHADGKFVSSRVPVVGIPDGPAGQEAPPHHEAAEIPLGDRWSGRLEVRGDEILVGKDEGFFAERGGRGDEWSGTEHVLRLIPDFTPRGQGGSAMR
jgi:hypothetical protein